MISPRPNTSLDTEKVPLPPLYTAMTLNTILKAPHLQLSSSNTPNTNISEENMIEQFPNQVFVKRGREEGRKTKAVLGCVINVIRVVVLNHLRLLLMAPHSSTLAWKIPWMEEPGRLQSMGSLGVTRLSDFTFTFHFHALEKEMATHSSVLAWRIPGTGEPGGLPSMGSHRVGHN